MGASRTTTTAGEAGLLERSAELAALGERPAAVRSGRTGRLVFVAGEAGIGKTALVRTFCDVADVSRGPRASTREQSAGLTAREVDVLQLVAAGLRNAEIAARLFV